MHQRYICIVDDILPKLSLSFIATLKSSIVTFEPDAPKSSSTMLLRRIFLWKLRLMLRNLLNNYSTLFGEGTVINGVVEMESNIFGEAAGGEEMVHGFTLRLTKDAPIWIMI